MIELDVSVPAGPGARLVLRPRRAMTARQFTVLFAALSLATFTVACFAWWHQGNVLAPVFALLDAAFIALVLRWVWRQGERFEVIALDARRLEVRRSAQDGPAFEAHPYWVRVSLDGGAGRERVLLGSQGRQVEVGAFLPPGERQELAARLKELLAAASGRSRDQDHTLG